MDPGIICFQHCNSKIFCFKVPEYCPVCEKSIVNDINILPFRIPYPFIRASEYPCAVIIKPTHGDFLNDYSNSKDLHIGITTSSGTIVEYDQNGLRRHQSCVWNQCLLLEQLSNEWSEHWDSTLLKICKQDCWKPQNYNVNNLNCYTFVLQFLRELNCGRITNAAHSRTLFCEMFILPKTILVAKYISLYRKLKKLDIYVENR